jgi:hypothetical protein
MEQKKETQIYWKLNNAWSEVLKEYGVNGIDANKQFKDWTGEYFEDPLSRMARIIDQLSETK